MRVLIITRSQWDDRLANGNTLSNLFSHWKDTEYACIYCRDSLPNNNCCSNYLSISPLHVAKNLLTPWRIGRKIDCKKKNNVSNNIFENRLIDKSKGHRLASYLITEFVYCIGHWLNRKCKKFINDFAPDVVFCFGVPDPVNFGLIKYINKNTNAVIVSYFVDDLYNGRKKTLLQKKITKYRLLKIAEMSDLCYGISQKMCDEYSIIFKRKFSLLFKGCEIRECKESVNNPIRFVYAGNLLFNRSESLIALANAINILNNGETKATLDVYSGTTICDEIKKSLNIKGTSRLNASKSYEEIKEIMHKADIVLHVESFDKEEMNVVRLSFSTKITDCMQSGSVLMAIGPSEIASIEYIKNSIPGTIVVNSIEDLTNVIKNIVEHPDSLVYKAKLMNEFAKKTAEIGQVRLMLRNSFIEQINKRK